MLSEIIYDKRIKGEVIDFTQMECGGCGIPFFVPTHWRIKKINEHGSFKCPNGCERVFVAKTEAEKLKEQLDELQKERDRDVEILQNRWLDTLHEKQTIEKNLKRLKNGVCPCCNRSFKGLHEHIKKQHPEFFKSKI